MRNRSRNYSSPYNQDEVFSESVHVPEGGLQDSLDILARASKKREPRPVYTQKSMAIEMDQVARIDSARAAARALIELG